MNHLSVTISTDDSADVQIEAVKTEVGVDNTDTWTWIWGIDHNGRFLKLDGGTVQHRDVDGHSKLLAVIIERMRGRKADR